MVTARASATSPDVTLRDLRTVDILQRVVRGCCLAAALVTLLAGLAQAQSSLSGAVFHITRANAAIRVDGDLSDEAWRTATRIEKWYEVTPGDNTEPPVKSVGYLTYDDRFLYVAFEFEDLDPSKIRAPLGDHDNISGNSMDFGGIFIDPLNTGRTALEFFVDAAATSSTTRSPTMRLARTRRPTSSGIRRRASTITAGWSRCGFRFRRCDTRALIRRRGASCCFATIRARFVTRSCPRRFHAAATARSAAKTVSRASNILPAAVTSSPRRT